jgi:hypothetical protein
MIEIHIRLDASGGPATRAVGVGVVHAEVDIARLGGGQPRAVSGVIVDIFNEPRQSAVVCVKKETSNIPVSRVSAGGQRKVLKEIASVKVVQQRV